MAIRSTRIATRRRRLRAIGVLIAAASLLLGLAATAPAAEASVASLANVQKPRISGLPIVGDELSASPGLWKGDGPFFYSYAWRSPTKSLLSGVSTYTPVASDIGQILTVRVSVQDGHNNSSYVDVSTAPITASDVVSKTPPKFSGGFAVGDTIKASTGKFASGSGALTYTYKWSSTDGQTSTPLSDTGPTHVITNADLGLYLNVMVTATSKTQHGSVTARTPGAVVPKVPFKTDAGLTRSNRGGLTVTGSKQDVVSIGVANGTAGEGVFVYAYSSPVVVGWFSLDSAKKFSVDYSNLSQGMHKLVVINQSGKLAGWVQVDNSVPEGLLDSTASAPIGIAAAVFVVLLVVALIVISRMRRAKRAQPRRH